MVGRVEGDGGVEEGLEGVVAGGVANILAL